IGILLLILGERNLSLSPWTVVLTLSVLMAVALWGWAALYFSGRNGGPESVGDYLWPGLTLLPAYASVGLVLLLAVSGMTLPRTNDQGKPSQIFAPRPFTVDGGWKWAVVAIVGAVLLWLPNFIRRLRKPAEPDGRTVLDYRLSSALDILMPAALLILVLGLHWGLPSPA